MNENAQIKDLENKYVFFGILMVHWLLIDSMAMLQTQMVQIMG